MPHIIETDMTRHKCQPDTPVRDVLQRMNGLAPHVFMIVCDDDGIIQGTVTDGDIRRGILAGHTANSPIRNCMFTEFQTAKTGEKIPKRRLRTLEFLPLVDAENRLQALAIWQEAAGNEIRHCMIMAGGYGKRLAPLTATVPKPLVKLGDRPILAHILDGLEGANIPHAYLSVHYLSEQFEDFVAQWQGEIDLELIHEGEKLGTAGALSLLPKPLDAPILVINGDVLTDTNYQALKDFHDAHGYDATIGVTVHDTEIPFGIIRQQDDGTLDSIEEKPVLTHFVAAGIYYLSPEIVQLAPKDREIDMPDLLNNAAGTGKKIGLFPIHEYWRDIGRPADLHAAGIDIDR